MRYEARFTATPEDVLAGYRMVNRQPKDYLKLCAFGGMTALLVFGMAAFILHFAAIGITGVAVGAGVFGFPWFIEWRVRRAAERSKPEEVKVNFTDEGIEISNNIMQSKYSWNELGKTMLDERGVLLDIKPEKISFFIPARAFVGGYFPLKELKSFMNKKPAP